MIIYGDPVNDYRCADLVLRLKQATIDVDSMRRLLILAGQIEQAFADGPAPADQCAAQSLTDAVAGLFVSQFQGASADQADLARFSSALESMVGVLERRTGDRITAKVPEGFAFYTLYPEQYITTSLRWSDAHTAAHGRTVLVVGLRSIGTSLSAVVTATLRATGWNANRCTVRPHGHPFHREVSLPHDAQADLAIVVDEGPGLSGSSMAAAATALMQGGVQRHAITLFPAHPNDPGASASEPVREYWRTATRMVTPLEEVRWNGESLMCILRQKSAALGGSEAVTLFDVSGGQWRRFAFKNETEWPAVNPGFERSKRMVALTDRQKLLWKFEGLLSSPAAPRSSTEITQIPTLASTHGFVAYPWIEGRRLTASDAHPSFASELARYVCAVAGPPLQGDEACAAVRGLAELLFWNTKETLGDAAAERARELAQDALEFAECQELPSYGDGRLAPHEFIRDASGKIFKSDWAGHSTDHTVIGKQSMLWDVAGLVVEWRLADTTDILRELPLPANEKVHRFYRAAYAAFMLGMHSYHGDAEGDRERVDEKRRLDRAELASALLSEDRQPVPLTAR